MTLGPVKPMSAFGSAILTSPREAKLAKTPAIVGFVSTDMYKNPASLCFASAAEVFAICMREIMPSYILAPPPEPETITRGSSFSVAYSVTLVTFSPTT